MNIGQANTKAIARTSALVPSIHQKTFQPIIQVLDFVNELYSSKFQVPSPGALVGGAGDLTLSSRELDHNSIGVLDAQEQLEGFKPKAFFHMCGEHSPPHPVFPGA